MHETFEYVRVSMPERSRISRSFGAVNFYHLSTHYNRFIYIFSTVRGKDPGQRSVLHLHSNRERRTTINPLV